MRQIAAMSSDLVYNDDNAGIRAVSYSPSSSITIAGHTDPPTTFDEYTEQVHLTEKEILERKTPNSVVFF